VSSQKSRTQALWHEVETLLAPTGLSLSVEKSRVCQIDEGFDFLGWRIQRRRWRGRGGRQVVYTYPSKKALLSVTTKVRSLTRRAKHRTLGELLHSVNRVLRGWCEYFRYGVSARTFGYLDHFTWHRVFRWLYKRHAGIGKKALVRRVLPNWHLAFGRVTLFKPQTVSIIRYRYRGARIPTPWALPA
jgi:RNA-directed DNA polymerase